MAVTMTPVSSSWIAALGWEGVRGKPGKVRMETKDGNVYEFFGVPWTFYRLWLESESHGRFYAKSIRGRYPEHRVRYVVKPKL